MFKQRKVKLHVSFYETVLPMFKWYTMLFQREGLLIHEVHYGQVEIIKRFLSYFVMPSKLVGVNTGKALKKLQTTENDLLPSDMIFIGSENNANDSFVKKFMDAVRKCSLECAEYTAQDIHCTEHILPLDNPFLRTISCINPELVMSKSKNVMKNLLSLVTLISNLLDDSDLNENLNEFDQEVRKICINGKLPSAFDSKGHEGKCLDWWIKVSTRYPTLFKIVPAILLIFHGPRTEGYFNEMKDIIDSKSGQMDITTFDAIQIVQYSLQQQVINGSYLLYMYITCC